MENFFVKKAPTGAFTAPPIIRRYAGNPILTKNDIPYPADFAFNAGVAKFNGKYYIAPRVDFFGENYPPSEWIGTAFGTSDDGISFTIDSEPCHFWYQGEELLWCNDTRLTVLDGELYASFCFNSSHSERPGIARWRGKGTDFDCICLGLPQQRNMILCPFKTKDGLYMRLERPANQYKEPFHIWYSLSPDLRYWGDSELLLGVEDVPYANKKIGGGAPPIKTRYGYLLIFHAVDSDPARKVQLKYLSWDMRYAAGAALFAPDDPTRLIGITKNPLMLAEAPYETTNDDLYVENCIFPCGATLEEDDTVRIYYGAGDWCTCLAETTLDEIIAQITPCERIAEKATVPFRLCDWKKNNRGNCKSQSKKD